jgi:hypothetical protein
VIAMYYGVKPGRQRIEPEASCKSQSRQRPDH